MNYSFKLFDSIDEVPLEDWNSQFNFEKEIFMDTRFIASVENSMGHQAKYWMLIIYDDHNHPVGSACLFLWRLDATILASPSMVRALGFIRRIFPSAFFFNALFLGLPVSGGQSQLRVQSNANMEKVCRVLEDVLKELARNHRAHFIILKEFNSDECQALEKLNEYGFLLKDSLPMNLFEPRFNDLDDYLSALRSHYRTPIRRSLRKAEKAGIRFVDKNGAEGAQLLYTDEVHRLYEAVLDQAEVQFERLPATFFREIAQHFGKQAIFTFVYQRDRVVGFLCSLKTASVIHMLFIGIDYTMNREYDIYFTTIYKHLDSALKMNVSKVYLGQNADDFKIRLGCYQEARHLYIRGCGVLRPFLRIFSDGFFPDVKLLPPQNIWRRDGQTYD